MPSPAAGSNPAPSVDLNEVARRAFELYCARGGQDGRDLDDWLIAERELQATVKSSSL